MEWLTRSTSRAGLASNLLRLPAELRAIILEYALTSSRPLVAFRLDAYQADSYSEAIPPPMTRVSKQLRRESLPIWYDCNAIVLYAEDSKGEYARRWLDRFEPHLPMIRHLELWIRYATSVPSRSPSLGILSIPMNRLPGGRGAWTVDGGDWRWVTVLRRPRDLEGDAQFLVSTLQHLLVNEDTTYLGPDAMDAILKGLRERYLKEKTVV